MDEPAGFALVDRPELLELPESLEGPRLRLRAYRPSDGIAFFAGTNAHRDELLQWMLWPALHQSEDDSRAYAARMAGEFSLRKSLVMGIYERSSGAFLGGTGFHEIDWKVPKGELGYFLLPTARGQGYALEAVKLLIAFGFEHAQFNRVWGGCDAANLKSAAVMRRAGMREEALLRTDGRDHRGRLRDTRIFALTARDYRSWRKAHGLPATAGATSNTAASAVTTEH